MNIHENGSEWNGLKNGARESIVNRDYSGQPLHEAICDSGLGASVLMKNQYDLRGAWIPGVDIFPRKVHQQNGRGYFAELSRNEEGVLGKIGLQPRQWASALMQRESAKGFHIHPPYIPDGHTASNWFKKLYVDEQENYSLRPYNYEQWDLMFFLTGICEMILVDERKGMPRRIMRFTIPGDSRPSDDNAGVIIPPGVAHALRNIGNEDLIMVYGTSTVFQCAWEGRIASDVEESPLPKGWQRYIEEHS